MRPIRRLCVQRSLQRCTTRSREEAVHISALMNGCGSRWTFMLCHFQLHIVPVLACVRRAHPCGSLLSRDAYDCLRRRTDNCFRSCRGRPDLKMSPSSRRRVLNSGLDARDQIACVTQAACECRERQHGGEAMRFPRKVKPPSPGLSSNAKPL